MTTIDSFFIPACLRPPTLLPCLFSSAILTRPANLIPKPTLSLKPENNPKPLKLKRVPVLRSPVFHYPTLKLFLGCLHLAEGFTLLAACPSCQILKAPKTPKPEQRPLNLEPVNRRESNGAPEEIRFLSAGNRKRPAQLAPMHRTPNSKPKTGFNCSQILNPYTLYKS